MLNSVIYWLTVYVSGRNTTYKFNFLVQRPNYKFKFLLMKRINTNFWSRRLLINSNFVNKRSKFLLIKERLATPSFRSPPKGAGVSNDKNGIQ